LVRPAADAIVTARLDPGFAGIADIVGLVVAGLDVVSMVVSLVGRRSSVWSAAGRQLIAAVDIVTPCNAKVETSRFVIGFEFVGDSIEAVFEVSAFAGH